MDRSASRRQFLALTATGVGLSVAGCSGLGDSGSDGGSDGTGGGNGSGNQATVIVQIDQQAMQSAQQNVSSQDINQTAAQQQLLATQQELLEDAVANVEDEIENGPVTIEERKTEDGAFLVSGPGDAIVDLLSNDSVGALFAASTFEEIGQSPAPQSGSTNQTAGG